MNIQVQELDGALAHAEKILAGIPGGVEKAARAAAGRTTDYVRKQSSERIRERYAVSKGNIRANENIRVSYSMGGGVSATVIFSGSKLPLYRFDGASPKSPSYQQGRLVPALVSGGWRLVHPGTAAAGHQLRGTGASKFENGFVAAMGSGHVGIFERAGTSISEIMGSSVPQMVGNDEVINKLSEDAGKKFEERMDHEIARILNGWGG